jgi:hypothetical protein
MFSTKSILTSAVVLASLVYLPTATADVAVPVDKGTFSDNYGSGTLVIDNSQIVLNGGSFSGSASSDLPAVSDGSFDYFYHFTIASGVFATDVEINVTTDPTGALNPIRLFSESLTGPSLFIPWTVNTGQNLVGSIDTLTNSQLDGIVPIALAAGDYTIEVQGYANAANVLGQTLGVNISGTVTAVPEPEQLGMLLLGLPMITWMVRRKQAA